MPFHPEGEVSPSGKYVVKGGKWVARETRPVQMPHLYGARGAPQFRNLTSEQEQELRSGERTGAMLSGAAPVAGLAASVLPGMAGGTVGSVVLNEGVDRGLRSLGVPTAISEVAGDVAGMAVGGGGLASDLLRSKSLLGKLIPFLLKRGAKETLKDTGEAVAGAAVKTATTTAAKKVAKTEAEQIASKILTLKKVHKLSDAQVVNSLRELYGISAPNAKLMIKMVMEAQ